VDVLLGEQVGLGLEVREKYIVHEGREGSRSFLVLEKLSYFFARPREFPPQAGVVAVVGEVLVGEVPLERPFGQG
jgi:hypothetical protein